GPRRGGARFRGVVAAVRHGRPSGDRGGTGRFRRTARGRHRPPPAEPGLVGRRDAPGRGRVRLPPHRLRGARPPARRPALARPPVAASPALLLARLVLPAVRRPRGRARPRMLRLVAVRTGLSFLLLWRTPSKWSFHYGSFAGVGAVFLALALMAAPRALRDLR